MVMGHQEDDTLHIDLWLMSCRVLKRGMEQAMLDELVRRALARGIRQLVGYYFPTQKNKMVREFYGEMGFLKAAEDEAGNSRWTLDLSGYSPKNTVIQVERRE